MDNYDLLENYFENTIIPQLYFDSKLILRKFTPPAMKQFSLSYNDIGKSVDELINNIRYPSIIENLKEVIDSHQNLEKEIQTLDLRWFQMNILPFLVRKENRNDGAIVTFVDITKRIKALTDLQLLHTDHTLFSYSVSHDIRQPLSTLSMVSTGLTEAYELKDDGLFNSCLELFKNSLTNITNIIDHLATQSTHKVDILDNKERINIEDIWEDVTLALKDQINKFKVNIITHFDASEILFSRINMRSILYNLLSNSIKYRNTEKQLEIKVSSEKIEGYVLFTIKDNGIGIDPTYHDKIFKESIRINTGGDGKGIGLFLVSTMLTNNHGKIEVESSLGTGATFKAYFPID